MRQGQQLLCITECELITMSVGVNIKIPELVNDGKTQHGRLLAVKFSNCGMAELDYVVKKALP